MIYTVTFNPSLDYILDLTEFERNQVNRTTGEKILPGGKGINVSIVLQNLGIDNRAICFTSGFTGEALKALLMQRDMNADFIDIANGQHVFQRGAQQLFGQKCGALAALQ